MQKRYNIIYADPPWSSNTQFGRDKTRGKPKRINASVRQLQIHGVREHSRKPDEIRNEIVRLCGDLPRVELFARNASAGWDVWGNEVESDIVL